MKIQHQLSIATMLVAGVFVTGCSQQSAGGSQVSGGSQSQIEGGSQVAGGSQQASSQQQVEEKVVAPVATPAPAPAPRPVYTAPAPKPVVHKPRTNRWFHHHPEAPACAKTRSHTHKYSNRNHRHKYSCVKPTYRRPVAAPQQPKVDVYALQRKLKAKGYYKGPIDGVVGPSTRGALKKFMNR